MAKNEINELDLIKSTMGTDLDESSVDIFREDLFGPPKEEEKEAASEVKPEPVKEAAPPAPEPVKPEPKPKPVKAEPEQIEPPPKKIKEPEVKAAPPREEPKPAPAPEEPGRDSGLSEAQDVDELNINIETGELKTVAASREEEKLDQTEDSLTQLEKMGGDFMSVKEIKKLFSNMNIMIDMLTLAMVRLDKIERQLKEKGILKDK